VTSLHEAVRAFKRELVLRMLKENGGNACRAARAMGVHRNTINWLCRELEIDLKALRKK
jgi:transcriptional regulator with GAF, ATPase, and Fis domain